MVTRDVLELRELAHGLEDARGPRAQLFEVRVLDGVLVLRARHPAADVHVLTRLQVRVDPFDAGELAAQAREHLVRAEPARRKRLERDEGVAHVGRAPAARSDERDVVVDVRVLDEHLVDLGL